MKARSFSSTGVAYRFSGGRTDCGIIATLLTVWIAQATHSPLIAALGYVLALILITGGFHLDGLADTCDGIFSARKRERMLEIMRDSRIGTHGCLALILP